MWCTLKVWAHAQVSFNLSLLFCNMMHLKSKQSLIARFAFADKNLMNFPTPSPLGISAYVAICAWGVKKHVPYCHCPLSEVMEDGSCAGRRGRHASAFCAPSSRSRACSCTSADAELECVTRPYGKDNYVSRFLKWLLVSAHHDKDPL